jgi:hypothetical protein
MKLEQIIGDGPSDERQQTARDSAAWKSFLFVIAAYVVIGIVYAIQGKQIPWSTEILATVAIIVFLYMLIKNEAINFRHPWLPETEVTLNQPSIIRSAPWLLVVSAYLGLAIAVTEAIFYLNYPSDRIENIINALISGLIGLALNVYFAKKLKVGTRWVVRLFKIFGVIGVIGYVAVIVGGLLAYRIPEIHNIISNGNGQFAPFPVWFGGVTAVVTWWPVYVAWKYGKQIVEDGKSFKK